jgi:hypothetical protein
MRQYFKLINTHMHGMPGGLVESESFSHDFRLPKCYDIPKFRETAVASSESGSSQLINSARCKQFPDKVLFYVFYNMPHDKAQLNAYTELQARQWVFLPEKMLWLKQNTTNSTSLSKQKDWKKKTTKKGKDPLDSPSNRTVIVFNPQLWKEEVVNLLED